MNLEDIKQKYCKKRYIAALVVVLAIGGWGINQYNAKRIIYQTAKISKCTITDVVEASGTINPVNIVSVGSTVSGLMKEIYVDYNSEVKKGQLLAQIDPANFQASVDQNTAQIKNAEANLAKLNAQLVLAEKTYNRYKNLYAKNFVAKSELDQAESDYLAQKASIGAQKASIAQARANYNTAMTNLGYTKIIAPVDGTIISRDIDVGQPVAASFQAPELFTIAQDLTKMQIEVNVSEADIGEVKEGQDVTYTLDAVRLASALGCRVFIGAGSQSEFGHIDGVLHPDTPCNPDNGYGICKLSAGMLSRVMCGSLGIRHIWCRIVSLYGPFDGEQTMVMSGIAALLRGERPSYTKGEQVWDYIYSKDAARAFRLVAERSPHGSIYCFGTGKTRLLRDFIFAIRDAVDPSLEVGIGERDYYPNQVMHLEADISNLTADTGFVPAYTFEQGIRETVDWMREKMGIIKK